MKLCRHISIQRPTGPLPLGPSQTSATYVLRLLASGFGFLIATQMETGHPLSDRKRSSAALSNRYTSAPSRARLSSFASPVHPCELKSMQLAENKRRPLRQPGTLTIRPGSASRANTVSRGTSLFSAFARLPVTLCRVELPLTHTKQTIATLPTGFAHQPQFAQKYLSLHKNHASE